MTTESKSGVCKFCGSPYHRGWQCRENPKNRAKLVQSKKTPSVSPRTSKRRTKPKTLNRPQLIKKYDALFSKYVRKKAEMENNLFCYTCGRRLTYDTAVVMHYQSRRYISTRFSEDNVKVGCRKCNTPDKDQPSVLEKFGEKLGAETVAHLQEQKQIRIDTPTLEANYKELQCKYSLLLENSEQE